MRPATQCAGGWVCPEKFDPIAVRNLDSPASSELLHRLVETSHLNR